MRSSAGFTLVETLVALSITAMLAMGGTTLLVQSTRAADRVQDTTNIARRLDLAHTLIRDDLANATRRLSAAPDQSHAARGFYAADGRRTGTLLSFVRTGWISVDNERMRSDLQRVSYFIDDGSLVRRAWPSADPILNTPYIDRVLADGLVSVKLRYGSADKWMLSWSPKDPALPDVVEVTLTYPDEQNLKLLFLVGGGG